jgi:prophage regulatory protein
MKSLRVLRIPEVCAKTGLSKSEVYKLHRDPTFPKKIQLTPGAVGYIEAEVDAWILSKQVGANHSELEA